MVSSARIVALTAENVKRISAVHIEPGEGGCVLIGGRNAQGKSSVLDSIMYALGGASSLPDEPIRHGEASAEIVVNLGEIIVRRKFTQSGSTVTVKTVDGASYSSPQKVLDGLFSKLSFDPLAFASMKPAEQSKALIALLGIDTTELDQEQARLYEERTGVNRLVKDAEADLARCPEVLIDVPERRPDLSVISLRLESAIEQRQALASRQRAIEELQAAIAECEDEVAAIDARESDRRDAYDQGQTLASSEYEQSVREMLDRHSRELADLRARQERESARLKDETASRMARLSDQFAQDNAAVEDRRRNLDAVIAKQKAKLVVLQGVASSEVVDVEAIRLELKHAEDSAFAFDATQDRKQKENRLKLHQEEADQLTDRMKAIVEKKRRKLAQAQYPIEGLAVNEIGTVLFNGVPLAQASRAQQIRTSVAIGIAMNPKLKVLLIRDGSLLDDENLQMVAEMARQHDAQIWIERVGDRDESAIIIEDGQIRDLESASDAAKDATPKKPRKIATSAKQSA